MKIDSNELKSSLQVFLDDEIKDITQIDGGSISQAFRIETEKNDLFLKVNSQKDAKKIFTVESESLDFLRSFIHTPISYGVLEHEHFAGLVLEWVEQKFPASNHNMEMFGHNLADLHSQSRGSFGLDSNNYFTTFVQSNQSHASWASFYVYERLIPMAKMIVKRKIMSSDLILKLETWEDIVKNNIPEEKPALIHGDLWGGNYIVARNNQTYLIDPAIYYGHREMDIAMSLLFSSFGRVFYQAYQEIYPMEKGFMERKEIHQLFPLLAHVYLFGEPYVQQVEDILNRYK